MRESAYQPEYGLLGAGAVNASLIGRLPGKSRTLGPVAAVSYRVASRIANALNAGVAARTADDLNSVRTILVHSPPDQLLSLLEVMHSARLQWPGKSLIFCDCETDLPMLETFRSLGASVAAVRVCAIPGHLVTEGSAPAITTVRTIARQLAMKLIELADGTSASFDAAVTLGSGALTPLIDHAADLFRRCGVRDSEAPGLAAVLFQKTALDYAHSGKQSWTWYIREPRADELEAQIGAVGKRFQTVLRELMLLGFEQFGKHPDVERLLRKP